MELKKPFFFSFFCLLMSSSAVLPSTEGYHHRRNGMFPGRKMKKKQLFVFGDSYADTGNLPTSASKSWKEPYGITFPGKPSGRFSDGRVLTDYIASYLGVKSPSAYHQIKNWNTNTSRHGVNFAHGGTGVFKTLVDQPNMTTQIDFLQQLIAKNVYTTLNLSSSVALVSLAGNDYSAFLSRNGSFQELPKFTKSVINQLMLNVKRIKEFGIKKIAITGIGPLGCLPRNTLPYSYGICNQAQNNFSQYHNLLLKRNILELNREAASASAASPAFVYLDLYNSFLSSLKALQKTPDSSIRLRPCCVGAKGEDCGLVDNNGTKRYNVCPNPKQSFFWDSIHPSNAGWFTVYSALKYSLHYLRL